VALVRGFGGLTVLAVLGALSAAIYAGALPATAWLGVDPLAAHPVVVGVLFALYLAAAWLAVRRLRPTRGALAVVLGFGLLFRVLTLPTPVYLSSDLYRYLWDGRVQLAGVNPYRYAPAAPDLSPLRDGEIHPRINRPAARTIYPPAAEWLFALAAVLAPGSIVGWRVLLLLLEGATVAMLLALLRRLGAARTAVIVYAWSPLVVFEGVQAGHVEVAMLPLVLLALLLRQSGSSLGAGTVLGVAVLMKLYPAVLLPAWWRRGDWGFPAATAATVGVGYLPYAAALGVGALGFLPEYFTSPEDHNIGLRALLTYPFGFTGDVARAVAMALLFGTLAATLALIARRTRQDPAGLWRASALAVGAYLLLLPTAMHPWYVMWVVPFLCVRPSAAWLWFSGAVSISYLSYVVAPAPLPWWAWLLEYGPLYTLLLISAAQLVRRAPGAVALRASC
jgi:alpha-1,6-mannosyltransferase